MKEEQFEVIIVGGSYSGLSAGMALGRALRRTLIIDSGKPCNSQTPYSHNFLTHDGKTPAEISSLAKKQVQNYPTVECINDIVVSAISSQTGFEVQVASGKYYKARKLIFATGVKDVMPNLQGYAACWGITVLHCPYCHGYEVRDQPTGILGNGEYGFEFGKIISNWTRDITLFTNGASLMDSEQTATMAKHHVKIIEKKVERLKHRNGHLQQLVLEDGSEVPMTVIYARPPFEQHCSIPATLGCAITDEGFLKTDHFQKTTVRGIFACGDNSSRFRTISNAVAMGTVAGMMANKEMIEEDY